MKRKNQGRVESKRPDWIRVMDRKNNPENNIQITEPEELLVVVEKMKSIPRIKPSRMFNTKVAFFSVFPTLWLLLTEDHPWRRLSERLREPVHIRHEQITRYSTVTAVALIAALLVFSGLTMAAKNSNPGDLLYSFKRTRESIEMAFTFNQSKKTKKALAIAETRLDELGRVINEENPNPTYIRNIVEDYNSNIASVNHAIEEGNITAKEKIEAHLGAVETAKNNLKKQLAAVGPAAVLTPAEAALVTVKDSQGVIRFGKDGGSSAYGETDGNGKFSFTAEVDTGEAAAGMEVIVETDGRKAVVPAYNPETPVVCGPYKASVTPQLFTLEKDQQKTFILTLSYDGKAAAGTTVRLSDLSGTSSIDEKGSSATLKTDENGSCAFEVVKTSTRHPSRISLDVLNGSWNSIGEVLALGGVDIGKADQTIAPAVTAQTDGNATEGGDITLDNGLITVSVDSDDNDIISNCSSADSSAGSTRVTEPSLSGEDNDTVSVQNRSDPRLLSSSADKASYEVAFEVAFKDTTLIKTYVVTLERGRPYASIDCTVNTERTSEKLSKSAFDICRIPFASGAVIDIGGNEIAVPDDADSSVISLNSGKPYTLIESGKDSTFISSPAMTGNRPESWVLGKNYIQIRPGERLVQNGKLINVSAIIAPESSKYSEELKKLSLTGTASEYENASVGNDTSMGFIVTTEPSFDDIKTGKQRFTISVFKEYERLLD